MNRAELAEQLRREDALKEEQELAKSRWLRWPRWITYPAAWTLFFFKWLFRIGPLVAVAISAFVIFFLAPSIRANGWNAALPVQLVAFFVCSWWLGRDWRNYKRKRGLPLSNLGLDQ